MRICMVFVLRTLLCIFLLIIPFIACSQQYADYPIQSVPFTAVRFTDGFWYQRIETNRQTTIPAIIKQLEQTGRIDNFAKAAGKIQGKYEGRRFNDTDVYKTLEGIGYSLAVYPDKVLEAYADSIIAIIGAAQEKDGYLYPARTVDPKNPAPGAGRERWINESGSHEIYNSGHLYEAAAAYYEGTGKRTLLDIAIKNADLVAKVFGPDKRQDAPGHEEIELALVKLYRITNNKKYIDLARFFIDQRGKPHDSEPYPDSTSFAIYNLKDYKQDHIPFIEQTEAVGHAVRAMYLYTGAADAGVITNDSQYLSALEKIWNNMVSKNMYITGGLGSRGGTESFGAHYELPNRSAYTETCASIGNVLWNYRMFLEYGDAKFIDIAERTMYNGLISGVSLSGDRFFYQNPLESNGRSARSEWFDVACCPPNVLRFVASMPGYVYALKGSSIYVNLYGSNSAKVMINGTDFTITQNTQYPWSGDIKIVLEPAEPINSTVFLRIPGWAQNRPVPSDLYRYINHISDVISIQVNGESLPVTIDKGYVSIQRNWQKGDIITLHLPIAVRYATAHDSVQADQGRIAFEYGPLVYCFEEVDNGRNLLELTIPDNASFKPEYRPDLLNGIVVLKGQAMTAEKKLQDCIAVPYCLWGNRNIGRMAVWMMKSQAK